MAQGLELEAGARSENRVDPPAPSAAMETYNEVRSWVDAGEAPGEAPEGLADAGGASVTLMRSGEVVGRGVAMREDSGEGGRAVWIAARAALAEAQRRHRAESSAAGVFTAPDWRAVTLSLELAGAPTPMTEAELEAASLALSPGMYGVAVRRGDAMRAVFPGAILRRNTDAGRALGALVAEVGGDAAEAMVPASELRERGYSFYRFRVAHLAQTDAEAAPVFLHRGGRVIQTRELTTPALSRFAEGIAGHLESRVWPGVERTGLMGDYDPVSGRSLAGVESVTGQAVAALSLARLGRTPGVSADSAERARRTAARILADLSVVEESERGTEAWRGAVESAACVVALAELGTRRVSVDPEMTALRDRTLARLSESFGDGGFADGVAPAARGLVAFGIVRAFTEFGRGDAAMAREAVSLVYRETAPGLLVGQMPWLGWADMELSEAEGRTVASAGALREMRARVWEHQLAYGDLGAMDRDLLGGIVFTRAKTPLPTWQSARPLAVLATMLGDESLTPGWARGGEAPGELLRVLDGVRFLRQLAGDVSTGHMFARPEQAWWGVRRSLWDQTMATESSALALLTVCETLRSMEALAERSGSKP